MKLYNSIGPNPFMVRMFMAEKGITLPMQEVDIRGGENRREPYVSTVNPSGQCPALETDSGSVITEITAICEYLEDKFPEPALIGKTPEEKAETRMWTRRIDLNICEPMANGFRFAEGLKMFQDRLHCIPQAADDLKKTAAKNLAWLDRQMEGRQFVAGDRLTLADVLLYAFLNFGTTIGQAPDASLKNVNGWLERMRARPSAKA